MQLSLPIGTCCGRLPRQMVRWLPEDVGDLETLRDVEDYKNCLRTRSSFTSSIFLSTPVGYPSRCHSFTTPLFLKYDTLRLYITPDSILLQVSVDSFATFWHYVALVPSRDTAS